MLILKTDADLPISVRNVGHSVGESLKRLEMTFATEMHLSEEVTSKVESHIYDMISIGRNVLKLGDDETFELDKLYARLAFYQNDYSNHATEMLMTVTKSTNELDAVAAMLVNEVNRTFTDEIQMSSVNRLTELQSLLETTAISTISGLLRLDWSAASFVAQYAAAYDSKSEELIGSVREQFAEKIESKEEFDFEEFMKKSEKSLETSILDFTKSIIAEQVSETMKSKYDEIFVHNEDLEILKNKAIEVAINCMTRGAAKKMILEKITSRLDVSRIELKDIFDSIMRARMLNDDVIESSFRQTLGQDAVFNFDTVKEDDSIKILCLPVQLTMSSDKCQTVFLGSTEIEIEVNFSDKSVKCIKKEIELIEAIDAEGIAISDEKMLIEILDELENFLEECIVETMVILSEEIK